MGFNLLGQNARAVFRDIWRDPHLAGFWPLNEGSAALYDRHLTNRNNATAEGGATYGGTIGALPGLSINAGGTTGQWIAAGQGPINIGRTTPFTVLAAAQHRAVNAAHVYVGKAATKGFYWQQNASGKPLATLWETVGPDNIIKESNTANVSGVPYLLGLTYDGGGAATGMTFWRNGSTEASSTVLDNLTGAATTTGGLTFGAVNSTGWFDGTLGFVAMFNAVKTPIEMKRWARLGGFV